MPILLDISSAPSQYHNARSLHLRLADDVEVLVLVEHSTAGHESSLLLDQAVAAISASLTASYSVKSLLRRAEMALESANQAVYGRQAMLSNSRDSLLSATLLLIRNQTCIAASVGANAVLLISEGTPRLWVHPESVGARLQQQGLTAGEPEIRNEHKPPVHGLGEPPGMFQIRQTLEQTVSPDTQLMLLGAAIATAMPVLDLGPVYGPFLDRTHPAREIHHTHLSRSGRGSAVLVASLDGITPFSQIDDIEFETAGERSSFRIAIVLTILAALLGVVLYLWLSSTPPTETDQPVLPSSPTQLLPAKPATPALLDPDPPHDFATVDVIHDTQRSEDKATNNDLSDVTSPGDDMLDGNLAPDTDAAVSITDSHSTSSSREERKDDEATEQERRRERRKRRREREEARKKEAQEEAKRETAAPDTDVKSQDEDTNQEDSAKTEESPPETPSQSEPTNSMNDEKRRVLEKNLDEAVRDAILNSPALRNLEHPDQEAPATE